VIIPIEPASLALKIAVDFSERKKTQPLSVSRFRRAGLTPRFSRFVHRFGLRDFAKLVHLVGVIGDVHVAGFNCFGDYADFLTHNGLQFGLKNVKQYQIAVSGVLYFMPNQFSDLQK
jgi:hypothetical protein